MGSGHRAVPRPHSRQQGCGGACCSTNGFSFLLQTPFQQQRWLRLTLCLSPWAHGRYVLAAPVSCLSLCAGGGQGEGQSSPPGPGKLCSGQRGRGERRKQGNPVFCPWELASRLLKHLLGVFHKPLCSTLAQPCPALTSRPVPGSYSNPRQGLQRGWWARQSKIGSSPEGVWQQLRGHSSRREPRGRGEARAQAGHNPLKPGAVVGEESQSQPPGGVPSRPFPR